MFRQATLVYVSPPGSSRGFERSAVNGGEVLLGWLSGDPTEMIPGRYLRFDGDLEAKSENYPVCALINFNLQV